jgi:predicted Holliday junction resolvase-like endonuclease
LSRVLIVSVLAVLVIALIVLFQELQAPAREISAEKRKQQAEFRARAPQMEKEMMEAEKMKQKKFQEYKKQGKLPKLEIDPKDDWYNYQAPGAEGIKQMEKAKKTN